MDVPDRDARTIYVRKQFTNDEITRSRKLEGQWWGDGAAYFVSSSARISPPWGLPTPYYRPLTWDD